MQRHALRQIHRVQTTVKSAETAAKASSLVLSRNFSTPFSTKKSNLLNNTEFMRPAKSKAVEDGIADIDAAVAAARAAIDGPWRTMSVENRVKLVYRLAELFEDNIDELAALEALDTGKPCSVADLYAIVQ
ncbi:hypothetical protein L917_06172 [Phytophthora nicotianae]|uniref:Aldehyde dehydrogenase domain-containing protein n=2 Tax=Phytophthora nicotianae TaxID=4792 RepID=W2LFR8_PHYNI|nr:hypothetical protein L917_06172 [Phytophthora nicotianae]ETM49447.1 hypothetical protein L914_06294 [Phytophthora nicotianae]ETO78478.1 hypothetical protein F444_06552 [Phytophthora nicotianae P1976]